MKKLILVVIIASAALGAALIFAPGEAAPPSPAGGGDGAIAYLPLDDRPDNVFCVELLARSVDITLLMPDDDLFGNSLDGQDGEKISDRGALFQWVRDMDEAGCDVFILSLDQLFSGGLVSSRCMTGENPIVFPGGEILTESEAFDEYILPIIKDQKNMVYIFDSLMRLASSVGYDGLDLDDYTALRQYGSVPRPALAEDELTLEAIFAAYPLSADGSAIPQPEGAGEYLAARERKMRLIDHVMDEVGELPNLRLLVGIDDSSHGENIQGNEARYLQKNLPRPNSIFSGLDSMGRVLTALALQNSYHCQTSVNVRYFGGGENLPASDYDSDSLRQSVAKHLGLFTAVEDKSDEVDIIILTHSPSGDFGAAVTALEENQKNGVPTIFIDASDRGYGDALEELLLSRIDFAALMGYSGRYDQASLVGCGLSSGLARYMYLKNSPEISSETHLAQAEQIANSMLLSIAYKSHAHYTVNQYIASLGLDPGNILGDNSQMRDVEENLQAALAQAAEPVIDNLERGQVVTDLAGGGLPLGSVTVTNARYPWRRTFEIAYELSVTQEA